MVVAPVQPPYFPMPYGIADAVPVATYPQAIGPFGVVPPPDGWAQARELAFVRGLAARRTPGGDRWASFMAEAGGTRLWFDRAREYRSVAGGLRGWIGTGVMLAAMGVTTLKAQIVKRHFHRLRPFQQDGTISPVGKIPKDAGYPSGHASAAFAAATVLGTLWPSRAWQFTDLARQVANSRMYAGVHFPSDVVVGARLGTKTALQTMGVLGVI